MKILNLFAENIKRIKVIDITPDATGVIVVEGKNAQGKTSVLDCILFALCGEKMIPDNVITNGETEGVVRITLDDVVITRTFKDTGTTKLVIENADGSRIMAPQTWLDARLGKLSFDPLAFSRLDKTARVNEIKRITGLDFSEVESRHAIAFEKRRMLNRDVETYTAQLKEFENLPTPALTRTVAAIREDAAKSIEQANKQNAEESARVSEIKSLKTKHALKMTTLDNHKSTLLKLRGEIARIENEIEVERAAMKATEDDLEFLKIDIAKAGSEVQTVFSNVDFSKELDAALEYEKLCDKISRRDIIKNALGFANEKIAALEKEMTACKEQKSKMISDTKMPVDKLVMTKDDVMVDGVAFNEISDAQKTQVSMAIAVSQNPEIKIVRIKEGSLLDKSMLAVVLKYAHEKDFQVWIERVADEPSGNAIYIENGMIKKEVK